MATIRVPFGSILKMNKTFTDYRKGAHKTNIEFQEGQIVPVDSLLMYTANKYVENGTATLIQNLTWEGYEEDFQLEPFQFNEYSFLKFRFKFPNLALVLPNINDQYEFLSKEIYLVNDGNTSAKIKYYDGTIYPNLEIEPGHAFKCIYIDDNSDKGRWLFTPLLYREDEALEGTQGSSNITFGADTTVLEGNYSAFAALDAGDFVAFINDSGTLKIRPALANNTQTKAIGFVKNSYALNDSVKVYISGINILSGMLANKEYFLSDTLPGKIQSTPPTTVGSIFQQVGTSLSATQLNVNIEDDFVISN